MFNRRYFVNEKGTFFLLKNNKKKNKEKMQQKELCKTNKILRPLTLSYVNAEL